MPTMTHGEKVLYTVKVHTTTGGRDGGASHSSDGRLDITHSIPGLPGTGTKPEQLFAAGWSACFEGAMVRLNVSLPGLERAVAQAQVDTAHQACPYSKATRDNVDVVIAPV